jgi:Skp family chaperone for outer membrane proteins
VVGIAALGLTAYLASQLQAQNQVQQAGGLVAHPKVAAINYVSVLKQYQKWIDFQKSYKDSLGQWEKLFEDKKKEAEGLKASAEKLAPGDKARDDMELQLKAIQRQMQDLQEDAKKKMGKYYDDQMVQVYKEVMEAVQIYARANDIEMVVHYTDGISPAEIEHPANIQRKLQVGACMPMYMAPGVDISKQIADMLNSRLGAVQPTGAQTSH